MKNKLGFLTLISLKRKIKTKWFVIANVLLALVIVGVINIDHIINFFGGDFNDPTKIYVIDETNYSYDILNQQIKSVDESYNGEDSNDYEVSLYDKDYDSLVSDIGDNKKILGFVINESEDVISVKLISDGFVDNVDYQLLQTAVNNTKMSIAISQSSVSIEELNKIYNPVNIDRVILDENKKSEEENMSLVMTTVFPIIILPFFMLTIFLVQMIGAEVNDEKTTRGMEIIISSVSPKTHFFSKILAGNIFVLLQGLLLIIYSGIGIYIRTIVPGKDGIATSIITLLNDNLGGILDSSFMHQLLYIVPLTLVLMIITFLAYSLVAGILSSVTTNTEDFQQVQTPIMIVLLLGYYLSIMSSTFNGALFIRIFSYVPFISAILSPSLLVVGQIGIIDILISIVIMIVTVFLLIKYGLRVYKVGILNYSSSGIWKKMFNALKNK